MSIGLVARVANETVVTPKDEKTPQQNQNVKSDWFVNCLNQQDNENLYSYEDDDDSFSLGNIFEEIGNCAVDFFTSVFHSFQQPLF